MKVSIIIPTYQPKEYIYKCLNSIKEQTLVPSLFEVIIILNGDKDPYYKDLTSFIIDNLDNTKLIYSDKKGVSNARNLGLDLAIGENIVFLDDDDYISANYLEKLLEKKEKNISIVVSNMKCDNKGTLSNDYYANAFHLLKNKKYNLLRYRKFLSSPCAKLIDINVISNVRFDHELRTSEDALFCFEFSKNIKQMILADEDCIYYRLVRDSSASRKKENFKVLFKEYLLKIKKISQIFSKDYQRYNLKFYISRILAFTKFLIIRLK